MKELKLEGMATFTKNGFHFDSGIPAGEVLIENPRLLPGKLKISGNACVDFVHTERVYMPPQVHQVADGEGYHVKRTSRNYLIQIKLPLAGKRLETQEFLQSLLQSALGEITLDREELSHLFKD